jgi:hypothetical protein
MRVYLVTMNDLLVLPDGARKLVVQEVVKGVQGLRGGLWVSRVDTVPGQ